MKLFKPFTASLCILLLGIGLAVASVAWPYWVHLADWLVLALGAAYGYACLRQRTGERRLRLAPPRAIASTALACLAFAGIGPLAAFLLASSPALNDSTVEAVARQGLDFLLMLTGGVLVGLVFPPEKAVGVVVAGAASYLATKDAGATLVWLSFDETATAFASALGSGDSWHLLRASYPIVASMVAAACPYLAAIHPVKILRRKGLWTAVGTGLLSLLSFMQAVKSQNPNVVADIAKITVYGRGGSLRPAEDESNYLELGIELRLRNEWGADVTLTNFCFHGTFRSALKFIDTCQYELSDGDDRSFSDRSVRLSGRDVQSIHLTYDLATVPSEDLVAFRQKLARYRFWIPVRAGEAMPDVPLPLSLTRVTFQDVVGREYHALGSEALFEGPTLLPQSENIGSAVWYHSGRMGPLQLREPLARPLRRRDFIRPPSGTGS